MKSRIFVDTVSVRIKAGDGGNGMVHFRREKFVPRGGPDGGDGGKGADVVLVGDRQVDSLVRLFYAPEQIAENGGKGGTQRATGRNGKTLVIPVPLGTVAFKETTNECLGEILTEGERLVIARGGKGGLGNPHWATATHQVPTEHTDGDPGEEFQARITLKIIADAGLVGFPNAGKSSLLHALTDAHPKIAAYPFTTLHPILGTLVVDDYVHVTLADIPGLVKEAHKGVGLGDQFLRHVERARCLVFVIDMAGIDGRDPVEDYRVLKAELKAYNPALLKRSALIVANKIDCPEAVENLKRFRRKTRTKPLPVCAVTGEGIEPLKQALATLVTPEPPA